MNIVLIADRNLTGNEGENMAVHLLESIDLKTFEESCKVMGDNCELKRNLREKYLDKQLSFQGVMHHNQNLYVLNVFEILKAGAE